jgi:hypothetical protein
VSIVESKTKLGCTIAPSFAVNLHLREEDLVRNLLKFFKCGTITKNEKDIKISFRIRSLSNIISTIVPFFNQYPIEGVKFLDFEDFCKIIKIMQKKNHLEEEGLNLIREIKLNMNLRRVVKDSSL